MPKENDGNLVTLLDEDGKEQEFEHLASLDYNGSTYVALIPYFENPEELIEDNGELVILKTVQDNNGEDVLSSIDDEIEFEEVARQIEDMLEDEYEIDDVDGGEEADSEGEEDGRH